MIWRLALLLCSSVLVVQAELNGIGVCTKQTTVSEPVSQRAYVSKTIYYTYRCWGGVRVCRASRALFDWQVTTKYIKKQVLEQYCCEGYVLGSSGVVCVPVCDPSCEHAQCVAPQRCVCDSGYQRTNSAHSCDPVCDPPCRHGLCDAPNICRCDPGYQTTGNGSSCDPLCSLGCSHGTCVGPEICLCDPGFSKDSANRCAPVCGKGCAYGICSAPEKCDCLPGYSNKEGDESEGCKAVCDFSCDNGFCSAPNVCSCDEGYELKGNKCEPICDKECKNGRCSEPNTCSCYEGYRADIDDPFFCRPVCNNSCGYGVCSAPNFCSCDEGYRLSSEGTCEPFCSNGCTNGFCSQPEKCSCNSGYVDVPNSIDNDCQQCCEHENECVPSDVTGCVCYQSYERVTTNRCVPFCSKECEFGECVEPEKCACADGYEKDAHQTHICRPVCSEECEFAECVAPNVCACNNGYAPSANPYKCSPICSETCVNAKCTAPNKCDCVSGFKKLNNESNVCVTDCSLPCKNGFCVGRDICQCYDGYVRSAVHNVCIPICDGCNNGSCIAPSLCLCDSGFVNPPGSSESCEPHCEMDCINGVCSAPDKCTCLPGYVKDLLDEYVCHAECSKICTNGNCTLPDVCECFPGYNKDPKNWNDCLPVCSDGCLNGVCSAPENCSCLWGFSSEFDPSNCSIIDASNVTNSWTFYIMPTSFDQIPKLVSSKIQSLHLQESYFLKHIIKAIEIGDYLELNCAENSVDNDQYHVYSNSTTLSYSCLLSKQRIDELQLDRYETVETTEATIYKLDSQQTTYETDLRMTDFTEENTTNLEPHILTLIISLNYSTFVSDEKITPDYLEGIQALSLKEEFHLCEIPNSRSLSDDRVMRYFICKDKTTRPYKHSGLLIKPFVLAFLISFAVYFAVFTISIIVYRSTTKKSTETCSLDHEDTPPFPNVVFMNSQDRIRKTYREGTAITFQQNQGSTDV